MKTVIRTLALFVFSLLFGCDSTESVTRRTSVTGDGANVALDELDLQRPSDGIDHSVKEADETPKSHETTAKTPSDDSTSSAEATGNIELRHVELRRQIADLPLSIGSGWVPDPSVKQFVEDQWKESGDYIWTLLNDDSVQVRRGAAVFLLEKIDSTNASDAAAFRTRLSDEDAFIQHIAIQAMKRLPDQLAVQAVPQLATLLGQDSSSSGNRADAARLLAKLGPDARDELPVLMRAARQDPSTQVRKACLFAVTRIGGPEAIFTLCRDLLRSDSDATVRRQAVQRLAQLGTAAAGAAADLAAALNDRDEEVRESARDALVRLGDPAVPPLIEQLDCNNSMTRQLAIFALGRIGVAARPALPALQRRLQDEDADVRALAEAVVRQLQSTP